MLCERCHVRDAGFGYLMCVLCEVAEAQERMRVRANGKPSENWHFHGKPRTRIERIIAEADEPSAPGTWRNPQ